MNNCIYAVFGWTSLHVQRNWIALISVGPAAGGGLYVVHECREGCTVKFYGSYGECGEDCDAVDVLLYCAVLLLAVRRLAAGLLLHKLLALYEVKFLVFGAHDRLVQAADWFGKFCS